MGSFADRSRSDIVWLTRGVTPTYVFVPLAAGLLIGGMLLAIADVETRGRTLEDITSSE